MAGFAKDRHKFNSRKRVLPYQLYLRVVGIVRQVENADQAAAGDIPDDDAIIPHHFFGMLSNELGSEARTVSA